MVATFVVPVMRWPAVPLTNNRWKPGMTFWYIPHLHLKKEWKSRVLLNLHCMFHPVQKMIDGRPDWLRMNGYRKPQVIQNADYFVEDPTLVQAFFATERKDALPVDQVLVTGADGQSTLLLPPGEYRIESATRDSTKPHSQTITIPQ